MVLKDSFLEVFLSEMEVLLLYVKTLGDLFN